VEKEGIIRFAAFIAAAVILACWETVSPRRPPELGHTRRWVGNFGVVVIAALFIRVLFPILPVALALAVRARGWGLLPLLHLPKSIEIILGFLTLDMAIYFQHRAFHAWRPLWRLHRMHHADTFFDFTTAVRFHPLEFILSMGFKLVVILLLGPAASAVLLFELGLNCVAMFNHANIRLPETLDAILRLFVVTPDMHRVHHSTDGREMNRNFGFNSPWWDRLFATYKATPDLGIPGMRIGLNIFRDRKYQALSFMLLIPFL